MNGNMYREIHQHSSYIMLISGLCKEWEEHISYYFQQIYELSVTNNTWHSCDPRAKFVVPVMSNCTCKENTQVSRAILNELWLKVIMNAAVLFLKSNEYGVTICNKTQHNQYKARTWNCTLGTLMRIQRDAIQLKALYLWRCSQCEILATLREASCSKGIMIKISTNVQLQCMWT